MSDWFGTSEPDAGEGGKPPEIIQTCPYESGSEIIIIDELGLPLASTAVTVKPSTGGPFSATTDATGRICLSLPPGTSVEVEVGNIHEAAAGESTKTASGQHFSMNGKGP